MLPGDGPEPVAGSRPYRVSQLAAESPDYVAVLGGPGSGKTTALKQTFLSVDESGDRLAVLVRLRDLGGGSLLEHLAGIVGIVGTDENGACVGDTIMIVWSS